MRAADGNLDAEMELRDHYFSRPEREREDFAHRYAREVVERLSAEGKVPFAQDASPDGMVQLGLEPKWFGLG